MQSSLNSERMGSQKPSRVNRARVHGDDRSRVRHRLFGMQDPKITRGPEVQIWHLPRVYYDVLGGAAVSGLRAGTEVDNGPPA